MLTNPTPSSASVTSSSLVEVKSSPSSSTGTPSASSKETASPGFQNLSQLQSPGKRKKKVNKVNTGLESNAVDVRVGPGPALSSSSTPASSDNGKKRSRKQQIAFRETFEVTSVVNRQPLSTGKRRANTPNNSSNVNVIELASAVNNKKGKNLNKNTVSKAKVTAGRIKKSSRKASTATSLTENSIVSYEAQQKIVLKKSQFIDPNLSFTIFRDLSRDLGAIGPSAVIIAVESIREQGTWDELLSDSGYNKSQNAKVTDFRCNLLSLYLSVPHFLPLNSVYSAGEPFARVLKFSALEEYTKGVLGKNQVSTFRFYGPRYEKQVPPLPASQENNPKVLQIRKRNPKPDAYLESVLIIKHPILGFYSRKLVNLKFIVLKKIQLQQHNNTVVGHLKAKVVQLKRSEDLKNIEIYVDENPVTDAASDVNAMNQQNIQPVIHTSAGLVPVITRTTYPQQEYHIQQQPVQQADTQFQYVQYHYQSATELVQELNSNNNLVLNFSDNSGEYIGGTSAFRDESGAQVLILSPSGDLQSPSSYIASSQQQVLHQQQDPANFYTNQEQSVIVQPQQQYTPQQLQQQQVYTIQQRAQQQQQQQQQHQIIQIEQPTESSKPYESRLIYLPGSQIPIEVQFHPTTQQETTAVYNRQQSPPEQLQVQIQQPQQQQFRSGQQIIIQQQPNQNHYQAQQQQLVTSQGQHQQLVASQSRQQQQQQQQLVSTQSQQQQLVASQGQQQQLVTSQSRQQQQLVTTQSQQQQLITSPQRGQVQQQLTTSQNQQHQVVVRQQFTPQSNTNSTTTTYPYRTGPSQSQVIVQHQQTHAHQAPHQQQTHVHQTSQQQHEVSSSCVPQVHHHQTQLSQIQNVQPTASQLRFQSTQQQSQQPTQQLHQAAVQARTQPNSQVATSVSSTTSNSLSGSSLYQAQTQRPSYQQTVPQQPQPTQFTPARAPFSPPTPPQPLPPTKQKGAKSRQPKKNAKVTTLNTNQSTASVSTDFGLTEHQLEQLRQREQKSLGFQPATPQPTIAQGVPPSPSPVLPGPPVSYPLSPAPGSPARPGIVPQRPSVVRFSSSSPRAVTPGQPIPRPPRPATPSTPVISSTTSLARFPSVSSGTNPAAVKSHNPSASAATQQTLLAVPTPPSSSNTPPHTSTPAPATTKKPKTFIVVTQPPASPSTPAAAATPAPSTPLVPVVQPITAEYRTKPGQLAVCPHCGVGNTNILRCNRCKHELPTDVKFIKDEWKVNKGGAAVAIPAPETSSPATLTPTSTKQSSENNITSTIVTTTAKSKPAVTGRKILLVNKPQPPAPQVQGAPPVLVSKTLIPGTVHVQIQPDGGSAVTINSGGVSVVQSKAQVPVAPKPPAKRRAPARKRQAHECITLSSDEEEPEPPKPKIAKEEVKPVEATTSSVVSTTSTATVTTVAVATTTTSTINSSVTKTVTSVSNSTVSQVQAPAKKELEVTVSAVSSEPSAENRTMPNKGIKINLSLDEPGPSQTENNVETDPVTVFAKIEANLAEVASKFEYAVVCCRSVRVGSYKVTSTDTGFDIPVHLTALGLKFTLPSAHFKRKTVKVCIPLDSILEIKAHFAKRLPVFFITTGPKYAAWVRLALGMDGDTSNESSNFYCPLAESWPQKTITLLGEVFDDVDVVVIKKMYANVLHEIPYDTANDMLMKITPQSYKSFMGFGHTNAPNDKSLSPMPKIISTTSMANNSVATTAASPSAPTVSSTSTVVVTRHEGPPPGPPPAGTVVGASNSSDDDQRTILSYEGNSGKVAICRADVKCLGYSQFLNDQIIDFWLTVIQKEILNEEDRKRTFAFDSFFYSKLTEKMKRGREDYNLTPGERRHSRVKKRTKNVDIFSKDFLIVPINENYHWFIAIICFPGMQGYHDYNSLEPALNYKRPKVTTTKSTKVNNTKKPVVYNQPKNETTAAYSNRDEAPEDPDEMDQISSPDTPGTDGSEPKSQEKTEVGESSSVDKGRCSANATPAAAVKRKSEYIQDVKHPCILIFDSLAGEARGRIYSTLREYLRIEYKTKKNAERVFDKNSMPGIMPKVPQQPNFSDCGLFLLQYVESFFSNPIASYDPKCINLKQWFDQSIAENKRRQIFDFISDKIKETQPQNVEHIPVVNFERDENDLTATEESEYFQRHCDGRYVDDDDDEDYIDSEETDEEDDTFTRVTKKKPVNSTSRQKRGSDSDDHNYATTSPKVNSATAALAATLPTVVVAITPLPANSDTTPRRNT